MTADEVIAHFALCPHPEGGWYRETWVAPTQEGERPSGTAILFLLKAGERSHWHRVDATEIWHFHAGAPLALRYAAHAKGPAQEMTLGTGFATGAQPQGIIPAGYWQSAQSLGEWSLVGCTVSPGFQFAGFELAPSDFDIPATA
ncbi:MAG: cupin domain-containing protein [Roseinatronobacter sp.]|nr:cupin domain-containing protein [Roseinatronobacter sp.]